MRPQDESEQSSPLPGSPRQKEAQPRGGLVEFMRERGIPLTRDNYLEHLFPDGLPEDMSEVEDMLPLELQLRDDDSDEEPMETNRNDKGDENVQAPRARSLEEINEAHVRHTDKLFRQSEGAASTLIRFHAGIVSLDVRVDDRLRAPLEAVTRNIANSWRREKELSGAVAYCASIYKSARWSGFLLAEGATPQDKEEAFKRMKEPADEPDVFVKMIEEPYGFADSPEAIQLL